MGGATQPRAGIFTPPWHTRRALAQWSIAAAAVIILWQYLIIAAAATQGTPDFYSSREVHRLIWRAFQWHDLYFCFGKEPSGTPILSTLMAGPALAAILWIVVCVTRCDAEVRLWLVLGLMLLPTISMACGVHALFSRSAQNAPLIILTGGTGEQFGEIACTVGPFAWTLLCGAFLPSAHREWAAEMARLAGRAEQDRRQLARDRGVCHACSYRLDGLPGVRVCPECGAKQPEPKAREASA